MYIYYQYDQQIVEDRVRQFRDQTRRYFAGELTEDEYLPLRLQNGLYVQRHAPMLRIAVARINRALSSPYLPLELFFRMFVSLVRWADARASLDGKAFNMA